jgi:NAD(P)-dependent dehydrogenase (short-subunit alcohol dehydrogenase family)
MTTGTFENKVAVVTGGASGIGAAVAAQLRTAGAAVEVADVAPSSSTALPVDITDADLVDAFAQRVRATHGRCDVLINCAGAIAVGDVTECTEEDWGRVFSVNVRGTWRMCKSLIPLMRDGSAIVNVASGAGLRAIPDMAAYVASKHAVVGLTRAMAVDHASRGIRANCVCPGLVNTPMARNAQELRPEPTRQAVQAYDGYLVKRSADACEVAESICFLASDSSRYITGTTLAVDGGRCMH